MSFFKIAFASLKRVKSRTFLTVLAIALGTGLLTGIMILSTSYIDSYLEGVSNQLGFTDIVGRHHSNTTEGNDLFDIDEIDTGNTSFTDIPWYLNHTLRIGYYDYFTPHSLISQHEAFRTKIFGIDPIGDRDYGYAEIIDSDYSLEKNDTIEDILKASSTYCVITTWVADTYDIDVDDVIYMPNRNSTTNDMDDSSTWNAYTVKAIINDYGEGMDISYSTKYKDVSYSINRRAIFITINEMRKVQNITDNRINIVYLHVKLAQLSTAQKDLQDNLPSEEFYFDNVKSNMMDQVGDSIFSMMLVLIIFTMISLIVSSMLIVNIQLMSVSEQKYETGVLRAIGTYKPEIFKLFFYQAFILGILGSLFGIILGIGIIPLLKSAFFVQAPGTEPPFVLAIKYNVIILLSSFGVGLIITIIGGVFPAYLSTRADIIQSLRSLSPVKKRNLIKQAIFPIAGAIMAGIGYIIIARNPRDVVMALLGIIPFILGIIIVSSVLVPILSKLTSYLLKGILGAFRQLTDENLKKNPHQTQITFTMFTLSIAFLLLISNTLTSIKRAQVSAVPRILGNDIRISSEGSTYGIDDILLADTDIINKSVQNATLFGGVRIKIDDYGVRIADTVREPKVTMYIIEPTKFIGLISGIKLTAPTDETVTSVFNQLDSEDKTVLIWETLANANHINKTIDDTVNISIDPTSFPYSEEPYDFDAKVIGVFGLVPGFDETWQDSWETNNAETEGNYFIFISWNTLKGIINDAFSNYPDLDYVIKYDDHDVDYWDYPLFNGSYVREILSSVPGITLAERVWDENASSRVGLEKYELADLINESRFIYTHTLFQNTSIKGMTNWAYRRHSWFNSIQDALKNGTHQAVITYDINQTLGIGIDDNITLWFQNATGATIQANFTVAGIVHIDGSVEAINFNSLNPYIEGNIAVAADDSTVVVVDMNWSEQKMHTDFIYEFWVDIDDYFDRHLSLIEYMSNLLGADYIIADIRWLFTSYFSYAPFWIIEVADGYTQEEVVEKIKAFLIERLMPVISYTTVDEMTAQYADQIDFQKSFFNIILTFALLISVIGIMISMIIAVNNRVREIGVLRAIGTKKGEVARMILGETLILIIIGLLLGFLISIASSYMLLQGLPLDKIFYVRLIIDYQTVIMLVIVVIISAIGCSIYPAHIALKLEIIEAIRKIA